MIHPSYTELIDAINTNNEEDAQAQVLNSRYSLVLATSKRARQLIAGAKPLVENAAGKKPLAIAIDELYKGKVKILAEKDEDEELLLEETDGETPDVIEETYVDEAAETENTDAVTDDTVSAESDEARGAETDEAEEPAGTEMNETEESAGTETNETDEASDTDETSDAGDGTEDDAEAADAAPEE